MAYIYQIKCLENDKRYIGYTADFNKRRAKHLSALRRNHSHCNLLQCDFNKFGEDKFEFSIIKETDNSDDEKIIINNLSQGGLYNVLHNENSEKCETRTNAVEGSRKLSEWIKTTGRTQIWVAKKLGITTAMVWNYTHGVIIPKLELVVAIDLLTDGEVKANDWMEREVMDD